MICTLATALTPSRQQARHPPLIAGLALGADARRAERVFGSGRGLHHEGRCTRPFQSDDFLAASVFVASDTSTSQLSLRVLETELSQEESVELRLHRNQDGLVARGAQSSRK